MFVDFGFWLCLSFVMYIYVGYPMAVLLLAPLFNKLVRKAHIEPTVTVIISAFNEEKDIERTVINKQSQDYPSDRLEVIVISDGSTDHTNEIMTALVARSAGRVRFLCQQPRQGKTQALNMAIGHTTADIVVFADANSIYSPRTISALVRNFADPSVGYVTGQMIYANPDESAIGEGSGTYMSYENLLRSRETRLGSIVGVDGGVDAVRRQLYVPMRPDQLPDFVLPLSVVEQGKRVVYEPEAMLFESALSAASNEFRMRVRVSLRALWALYDKRNLLNPLRFPLFAWQLISHKLLRYGAFIPLFGLILFNALAIDHGAFFLWFFVLQMAGYCSALLGHIFRHSSGAAAALLLPYYFLILNLACLIAVWKFFLGQKMVLWKPRGGA